MSFVSTDVINSLGRMDRSSADNQPFGVVQVDDDGVIKMYNKWESDMAGVSVSDAEGKNFFTQVAPCTNNRLVFGKFKQGVQGDELDKEFNYTFTYKMKPTNVVIRLLRDSANNNWVFVSKRAA